MYNGDLTGRIVAVDADKWLDAELQAVIDTGARLLNVRFTPDFKTSLLRESYGSVYIVQEACRQACIAADIIKTQPALVPIGEGIEVRQIVRQVVAQQSGRYTSFITQFAAGFQETRLQVYKWLLHPVLTSASHKLEQGFKWSELRKAIQEHHPVGADFNPGNLTQALQSVASLQIAKNIKPIILDYDQTNTRLNVVDRGFIIWLEHQDPAELLELAGLAAQGPAT